MRPLVLALAAFAAAAHAQPPAPDWRPVVLTGDEAPALQGAPPAEIVAFAWDGARWAGVPVQVDERFVYDLAVVYRGMRPADCPFRRWCRDLDGAVVQTGYADPGTHVGPDPDAHFDADDELALMRADMGARGRGHPRGVDAASATEVVATVGGRARYAYLYRRTDPALDPSAGRAYVRYAPAFARGGTYLETYDRGGRRPPWLWNLAGWPLGFRTGNRLGANREHTTLETPFYAVGWADRWILDRLHLGREGDRGPDVLDVDMIAFLPGACVRTPYTGSVSEGGFVVNRAGPVRVLREVVGFNSGPLASLRWTFYARHAESEARLRVHAVPGAMSFVDLSREAAGLVYRSPGAPGGVRVDGRPDRLARGPLAWEGVSGPHGGYVVRYDVLAEGRQVPRVEAFYLDDARPEIDACMLDRSYYGAHGLHVRGPISNTDPRRARYGQLALRRRFVFGPDFAADVESTRRAMRVEAAPWAGTTFTAGR